MSIYVANTGTLSSGTTGQISANGTGNAVNVVGAKNFNLIVQCVGTGTAVCRLEGTTDNSNWYPITWGTSKSTSSSTLTSNSTVSNQAHERIRLRMKVPSGGFSDDVNATFDAWVVYN